MRRAKMTGDPLAALLALSGAVAVMAGAFGAHGVSGEPARWLGTGAEYAMIHAVAGLFALQKARAVGWLFLAGSVIFSGSLYLIAVGGPHILGAIIPLGGLAFIVGWMWLAVLLLRGR